MTIVAHFYGGPWHGELREYEAPHERINGSRPVELDLFAPDVDPAADVEVDVFTYRRTGRMKMHGVYTNTYRYEYVVPQQNRTHTRDNF